MSFFQSSGGSGRTVNEYDFTLVNGCRHFMYNLSKEGATEIRVVPAIVNGVPEPLIDTGCGSTLQEALTSAFAVVDVARFLGPNKASMICPPPVEGERVGPVHYFINTLLDTAENDPKGCPDEWLRWCGKGRDRPRAVVQRPQQLVLMQGFLYSHKGHPCLDKDNRPVVRSPVVLMLNRSATTDLLSKLSKPLNSNALWGSENNRLGDPVDLSHGRMLKFSPYQHEFNNLTQTWYMAEVGDEVPISLDDAMTVWQPWDKVLNYQPTLTEVGAWLAKAFSAEAVVQVFENHPVYRQCISENIRAMAKASVPSGYDATPTYNKPAETDAPSENYRWVKQADEPYPPVPASYAPAAPASDDDMDDPLPFNADAPVQQRQDVGISPATVRRVRR